MEWWGILIFGIVLVAASALITWLIVRREVGRIDRDALAASAKVRDEEVLAAERKKRESLELLAEELIGRLEDNRIWYEKTKEVIDEELHEEYDDLARDDGALLGKLAELLGSARASGKRWETRLADELEATGRIAGEGSVPEEGGTRGERGDPTRPGGPPEDPEGSGGEGEEGGGGGDPDDEGRGGAR